MTDLEELQDILRDEADWNDYVSGRGRQDQLFCGLCGYITDAHWKVTLAGKDSYQCPTENEARYRWGDL